MNCGPYLALTVALAVVDADPPKTPTLTKPVMFNTPEADKILAEQGILLKRGDGHIVLAQCGSEPGLLEVWPRDKAKVCFRVTGNEGYLSLEIPSVYGIKGNEYTTEVTMTVGNEEKSFDVVKNGWTQVGETVDPNGRDHMLVEIIATR